MVLERQFVTPEAFDRFVDLPENADKLFEYIGGEIVEVVSNNYSSETGAIILSEIRFFSKGKDLGRVTGADGGYIVSGDQYIPDVAFISKLKQPEPCYEAYNPNPPDLAVEMLSPSNNDAKMRVKIANYLAAGTMIWVVDPIAKFVEIYVPGKPMKHVGIDGVLDGGEVLPGFTLPVQEIFPQ